MLPGTVIAHRFVIEMLVGTGGMGRVYRAFDRQQSSHVALKIIAEKDSNHAARFVEEARILSSLTHDSIVQWIAHGEDEDGQRWLALEWLDGEDLEERLSRSSLSIEECVDMGVAVAEGLAVAHAHGIIHRDIKPSNIFLVGRDASRVKLLDFGVARRSNVTRVLTRSGVVVGTVGYIPPEQVRGDPVDARADVFGLGAVLYECLTGRPAFAGGSMMSVLKRLLVEEPPLLRNVRGDVPEALEAFIATTLSKDPKGRPSNGAAMADALRNIRLHNIGGPAREAEKDEFLGDRTFFDLMRQLAIRPEIDVTDVTRPETSSARSFVGRDREINTLRALYEHCVEETVARAVHISGPAGIGKSRLGDEFMQLLKDKASDATIWVSRGDLTSDRTSYSSVRVLLGQTAPETSDIAATFLDLVANTLDAGPLVILLDNVQWMDSASVHAVEQALRQHQQRPLFVLALGRPDMHTRFPRLWADLDPQEVVLGSLASRSATRMIRLSLGEEIEPSTVKTLLERSGGHPFYLRELIRALASGQTQAVPAVVLLMQLERLAVLGSRERRVLRAASLFGNVFWVRGVQQVLGMDVRDVVESLVERQFLTRQHASSLPNEQELAFRESLVREAIYETMTAEDAARGHALANAWIAAQPQA